MSQLEKHDYLITFDESSLTDEEVLERMPIKRQVKDAVEAIAGQHESTDDILNFRDFGIASAWLTEGEVSRLKGEGHILSVSPNRKLAVPEDSEIEMLAEATDDRRDSSERWNITQIKAEQAWEVSSRGAGVKVAVIDSGIENTHSDLSDAVKGGASFRTDGHHFEDSIGHGTSVAGIIGARRGRNGHIGVSPECELYSLKVLDRDETDATRVITAMQWALRERMDIVNISLFAAARTPNESANHEIERAAGNLLDAGCLVIGIAGNKHEARDTPWVSHPARARSVLAVAMTRSNGQWHANSMHGPPSLGPRNGVELLAPGFNLETTQVGDDYRDVQGTSYAAPHVAGAAALLKSAVPDLTGRELRKRLTKWTAKPPPKFPDPKTGFGTVDCKAAITQSRDD